MKIQEILKQPESKTLEFKISFNREVIETLTAFANTSGGSILIGIDDNGELKGLNTGKETLQNWLNQIKTNTIPALFPDIDEFLVDGNKVVKIFIEEHPIKPVSCKGRYFFRRKNSNHRMSITEISDFHLKTFNAS